MLIILYSMILQDITELAVLWSLALSRISTTLISTASRNNRTTTNTHKGCLYSVHTVCTC